MSAGPGTPRRGLTEWSGDAAVKVGVWFLSVAILNFLVGSPLTDLYVGFSIVAGAFWVGWKASNYFDEPETDGSVELGGADGLVLRGSVEDGEIRLREPGGAVWTGTAWVGSWSVEDPEGVSWHGRVSSQGAVTLECDDGRVLTGRLTPER